MDLPSGLNRRYATTAVILLVAIWLWVAFDRPYVFPDHIPWNIYSNSPQAPPGDIFDFPPLTSPAIKQVCANTQWNTSLVFTCDSPAGSFAEVRNSILHCVRYAIAAGASLVMPRIVLKEDYGGLLAGNTTHLDHLFDAEHFAVSLDLSCPQLRLYMGVSGVKGFEHAHGPIPLSPDSLASTTSEGYASEWREGLYKWLTKYISVDTEGPVIISLSRTYLRYPIHSDDDNFAQHFGKILKIRSDARNLATTALLKLLRSLDLKHSTKLGFLAAYLSTAPDPDRLTKEDQHYALYETQSELYLDYATHANISVIYVASNQGTDVPRFLVDAKARKIKVKTKFDLLEGRDLEDLQDMTTIQREMVDYLVMMNAATFLGVGYSGISWKEALRRHGVRKIESPSDPAQQFNDGLSVIYGKAGGHSGFLESMWP
jgi:hypothetical protein